MRCFACQKGLSDREELLNSDEDFIDNKCLCAECLVVKNSYLRELEDDAKHDTRKKNST